MSDTTILNRVIFPPADEPDVSPLFLDADEWTEVRTETAPDPKAVRHRRGPIPNEVTAMPLRISHRNAATMITGRRSLAVPAGDRVSLGTYFNAFPAGYWKRWTSLDGVRLRVETDGVGDVIVYRSNARGVIQTVDTAHVSGPTVTEFDLSFSNFLDGGWYWFDLMSRGAELDLVEADWRVPTATAPSPAKGLTIALTTLNRQQYCLDVLATIAGDPLVMEGIDEIIVVDQGSQLIREHEDYNRVADILGERLRVIEQPNVGGSGGFSRGMLEAVRAGTSDHVMLLDDDVSVEPEAIRRAQQFSRYCSESTIVGGHMFDMYDKTKLHAYAEGVDRWTFMWGPITPARHDFTALNLRQTTWMHRRYDVDYNGWWMCLIPVEVIRRIGLSLPVFIKWDDAEYALRAAEHGFRTVTLPGAAVWHVSWVDKDDSRDWQAFYHARNRLLAGLLHSPHKKGGRLPISSLANDLRHLLTMDYSTVALRVAAYDSVLEGPGSLHPELATRLGDVRRLMGDYRETQLLTDTASIPTFPATRYFGENPTVTRPTGRRAILGLLSRSVPRHAFAATPAWAHEHPDAHVPHGTPWWLLVSMNSYLMSNAEGSGVSWHIRNARTFRRLLRESLGRVWKLRRRWGRLSDTYRRELPHLVSMETWSTTLGTGNHGHEA
jgi:galactofuranosylgalactofuranosylrhamnosyl-N-acetylglucosaminyl-diphospho-decaprenol beta-1,5/1,6-galactofuranosyltransferase